VLFIEDDFSRIIAGWAVEAADPLIACFEQAVQRYGRPQGVMSDRGSAFHSWRRLSRFEALLEEYEINYFLAKEAAVNGKVEALNASFQKECIEQGLGAQTAELTNADARALELFRVLSRGGTPAIWSPSASGLRSRIRP
jgi:transposase InsO family protein